MHLTRRYVAISASVAVMSLLVLATPAAAGKTQLASLTAGTEAHSKTIDIVGADRVVINRFVESTFRFKPGTVHVKQGETVALTNQTTDVHTFTLVDPSLLPTAAGVFGCGGPGTVCGAVLFTHILPCLSAAPGSGLAAVCASVMRMTGPPPTSCTVTDPVLGSPATVTFCFQLVGPTGGSNPSSLSKLPLTTAWTTPTSTCAAPFGFCRGDSVLVFPGETDISWVVNLAPGTHHFMCVFHPWMQGELVVEK